MRQRGDGNKPCRWNDVFAAGSGNGVFTVCDAFAATVCRTCNIFVSFQIEVKSGENGMSIRQAILNVFAIGGAKTNDGDFIGRPER
jgi:hypothetical protein